MSERSVRLLGVACCQRQMHHTLLVLAAENDVREGVFQHFAAAGELFWSGEVIRNEVRHNRVRERCLAHQRWLADARLYVLTQQLEQLLEDVVQRNQSKNDTRNDGDLLRLGKNLRHNARHLCRDCFDARDHALRVQLGLRSHFQQLHLLLDALLCRLGVNLHADFLFLVLQLLLLQFRGLGLAQLLQGFVRFTGQQLSLLCQLFFHLQYLFVVQPFKFFLASHALPHQIGFVFHHLFLVLQLSLDQQHLLLRLLRIKLSLLQRQLCLLLCNFKLGFALCADS
mmetsp:Transcript_10498/g.18308  ORF Transcript_10498/g.18308 Transcript_10498/m.18308 type:complete len:283 (-) Transcript_10498:468-1316(-)